MSRPLSEIRPRARLGDPRELCEALEIPFSEQQLAAITAPLEPGVIIAGAGSGKTTVMAARVVWLVGTGAVRPEQVLGLTFTRKAAAELSQRVRSALLKAGVLDARGIDDAGEQVIMTYDAFAARLVAEHGLRIGVDAEPTMITGATRYRLGSRVVAGAAGPFESLSRLRPVSIIERVLKLDEQLQSHLVSREELDRHAREYRQAWAQAPLWRGNPYQQVRQARAALEERLELVSLVADYQRLKQRLGVVEFGDQMAVAARLAGEVTEVSQHLRAAYRVVLLDEYQDTSAAQASMLRGLFSGADEGSGRGHPVTAVGDPFQAIYGWRGAAASNILQFANDFPRGDGTPAPGYALTVNRRSGQTILDVANKLAAPLRNDPLIRSDLSDQALIAPASSGPGEVRAATFATWPEEVSWLGEQIAAAHGAEVRRWSDIAVLTRRNSDIAAVFSELSSRDIPVEIVGLGGLLELPEVLDVVCTLRLLDDVTANPELVRLLTGPRWSVGPHDLALLGARARALAKARQSPVDTGSSLPGSSLLGDLEHAVADVDPSEVVSLLDALTDPGDLAYSAQARERFARFADELEGLRTHTEEPVLDLTRRVIGVLGLDVELLATPAYARTSRRNQLAVFVDAVGDYVDVDGDASLPGLLAYLRAEVEQGNGLDQAVPSDTDSVKLLTVHKAKGLEWTMVYVPALVDGVFPTDRGSDNWISNASVIPAELRGDAASIPQLSEATKRGIDAYKQDLATGLRQSEDRLGYVAVTRAKRVLVGSGHVWRPGAAKPRKPSDYLTAILTEARRQGNVKVEALPPRPEETNPLEVRAEPQPWPKPLDPDDQLRRIEAARAVAAARARFEATGRYEHPETEPVLLDIEETIATWDADCERLVDEVRAARRGVRSVELPQAISATNLLRAHHDPEAYAAELIRPMPHPPSRAAAFGTRFHRFVERHFGPATSSLFDPEEFSERADAPTGDELDLRDLCRRFAEGRYGQRAPYLLEKPFTLALGEQLVRGRIDAIYRLDDDPSGHLWQVVDWKTGRAEGTDPGQLAIYRLAWAELAGIEVERVDALFYFVRTDRVVRPDDLPDREGLMRMLDRQGLR